MKVQQGPSELYVYPGSGGQGWALVSVLMNHNLEKVNSPLCFRSLQVGVGTWKSLTQAFVIKTRSCISIWSMHVHGNDISVLCQSSLKCCSGPCGVCLLMYVQNCLGISPQTMLFMEQQNKKCSVISNCTATCVAGYFRIYRAILPVRHIDLYVYGQAVFSHWKLVQCN